MSKIRKDVERHANCMHFKPKNFSCTVCEEKFVSRSKVARHVKVFHDIEMSKAEEEALEPDAPQQTADTTNVEMAK